MASKVGERKSEICKQQGRIQEFLIGGGGGEEVQTLVQKGLLNFFVANYFSPTPLPTSRLHVKIPWPLTVYFNSTRKGCIVVDQLKKS